MSIEEAAKILGLESYLSLGQLLLKDFDRVELLRKRLKMDISDKKQRSIKIAWANHIEENPNDFNDSLGSVMSIYEYPYKVLKIVFRKGDFSQFFGTVEKRKDMLDINSPDFLDFGACLPISFGAIALTKPTFENPKGCIVFAKRGKTTFDENKITLIPGGYFNPDTDYFFTQRSNRLIKNYSLIVTVLRELFEETGVFLSWIKPEFLGIVYSKQESKQPLIALLINLPCTVEELKNEIVMDEENQEIVFVPNDVNSVKDFIKGKTLAIHDAWKLILFFERY